MRFSSVQFQADGSSPIDAQLFRRRSGGGWRARGRPTNWVLKQPRSNTRHSASEMAFHDESIARLLGLIALTLRGAPFVYYGERARDAETDRPPSTKCWIPSGAATGPRTRGEGRAHTDAMGRDRSAGFTLASPGSRCRRVPRGATSA